MNDPKKTSQIKITVIPAPAYPRGVARAPKLVLPPGFVVPMTHGPVSVAAVDAGADVSATSLAMRRSIVAAATSQFHGAV